MKLFRMVLVLAVIFSSCEQQKEVLIEEFQFDYKTNNLAPNLVASDGTLGMSWLHVNDSIAYLMYNQYENNSWKTPKEIAVGSNWFVNWADFPANAVNGNLLLTSYLEMSGEGTFMYDVVLNLQNLDGNSIREKFILHSDGVQAEHGFVSMIPNERDGFYVSWLDGRNTGGVSHVGGHDGHAGTMTIRTAEITSKGAIVNELQLDSRTCDCCQTTMTSTSEGPLVVYRDRSEREIRDIYFTQKIEDEWTEPKVVFNDGWKINGCPVNGPKTVSSQDHIAVAWFTAANDTPFVKVAFSKNGVVDFQNPVIINDNLGIGRVDIAFMDDKHVLVSYMESDETTTYLKVKKVSVNGSISKTLTIAELSASRGTGVPQLEILDEIAYLIWTDQNEDIKQLKGVKFSLKNF